jgi:hypothetical protein
MCEFILFQALFQLLAVFEGANYAMPHLVVAHHDHDLTKYKYRITIEYLIPSYIKHPKE